MPKNKGAGGKKRRKGKGTVARPRELTLKEEGEEYGQIIKSTGNGFMDVNCFTNTGTIKRRGHIRGNMRKRVFLIPGDIVLVSIRGYQDNTCDILFKYNADEARLLRSRKLIPENIDINNTDIVEGDNIVFGNVSNSDEETNSNSDSEQKVKKVAKQTRNLDMPSNNDSDNEINLDDL